jgi:hypothetical protein
MDRPLAGKPDAAGMWEAARWQKLGNMIHAEYNAVILQSGSLKVPDRQTNMIRFRAYNR